MFREVLDKSGNRTVRVIFDPPLTAGNTSDALLQELLGLGCSYEGANPSYLCVTIPPGTDFDAVCERLASSDLEWEHADPSYDDLYPEE